MDSLSSSSGIFEALGVLERGAVHDNAENVHEGRLRMLDNILDGEGSVAEQGHIRGHAVKEEQLGRPRRGRVGT